MRKVLALAGRELRAAFASPLAYIVMAVFLAIMGMFFYLLIGQFAAMYPQAAAGGFGPGADFSVDEYVVKPLFGNMGIILLFVLPLLTMRLLAEERRQGTMELLLTTPLTPVQIVLGKFLGALATTAVVLAGTLPYFAILSRISQPDWRIIATSYLGTLLLAGAFLAIGLLTSSWTENQIIAGVLGLGLNLALWILNWFGEGGGGGGTELIRYLSLLSHVEDFHGGVIDSRHVVYLLSAAAVPLFLAVRSVESQRWR